MSSTSAVNLPYEIREQDPAGGALRLELVVEGEVVATAGASADVLHSMDRVLGLDRQSVVSELRNALEDLLKDRLDKVTVSDPREDLTRPLRFHARYTYRDHTNVETGLVWYEVKTSATGPEGLSAIVRNKMRLEVHRKLTSDGGAARALLDMHR